MKADIEGVRNALKVLLLSDPFKDVLSGIYDEKSDASSFEPVAEVYTSEKRAPQNFPCAQIIVGPGRTTGPDSGVFDVVYGVQILWAVAGTDEELLESQIDRLLRATQDFFKSRNTLDPAMAGISVWPGDEDYSPLLDWKPEVPFIKAGLVELAVRVMR